MGFVKLEKQGHVGIMTIDRQEALNALNSAVLTDLDAAIDQAGQRDLRSDFDRRGALVRGGGGHR